jgi:hypothetical protein
MNVQYVNNGKGLDNRDSINIIDNINEVYIQKAILVIYILILVETAEKNANSLYKYRYYSLYIIYKDF